MISILTMTMNSDNLFYTIDHPGYGEYEEKKSRFLGEALPVASEEEVRGELARIRKKYYDARHHCYAYVIGGLAGEIPRGEVITGSAQRSDATAGVPQAVISRGAMKSDAASTRRSSDDGEPSGTAGAPILSVIDGKACSNVLIVVTRYFGGTLLGTGGLVRSYTKAASLALENAGVVCMRAGILFHLSMPYSWYDKVLYRLRQHNVEPAQQGFGTDVSFDITVPTTEAPSLCKELQSACAGQIQIQEIRRGYFKFTTK